MRVISYTDFQSGLCVIPVHSYDSDISQATISQIDTWIDIVQPKVLIDWWGVDLYNQFISEIDKEDEDDIEPRWEALKNVVAIALVYFVFYEYEKYKQTLQTEQGERQVNGANQTGTSIFRKLMTIYNVGVDKLEDVYDLLQIEEYDALVYPEFVDVGFDFDKINSFDI